jgi:hypothetical protein
MNRLITVVGITIVSLLLAGPFFLQTQNVYESDTYEQGHDVELILDSDEATEQEEEAMEEADNDDD